MPEPLGSFFKRSADQESYVPGLALSSWFEFVHSTGVQSWLDLFDAWL
jgi:hypothetical protein